MNCGILVSCGNQYCTGKYKSQKWGKWDSPRIMISEEFRRLKEMSEFSFRESERCQNLTHFIKNNLSTNLIRHTIVNTDPLEWYLLNLDDGNPTQEY